MAIVNNNVLTTRVACIMSLTVVTEAMSNLIMLGRECAVVGGNQQNMINYMYYPEHYYQNGVGGGNNNNNPQGEGGGGGGHAGGNYENGNAGDDSDGSEDDDEEVWHETIRIRRYEYQANNNNQNEYVLVQSFYTDIDVTDYNSWEEVAERIYDGYWVQNNDNNAAAGGLNRPNPLNPDTCWPGYTTQFGHWNNDNDEFENLNWLTHAWEQVRVPGRLNCVKLYG